MAIEKTTRPRTGETDRHVVAAVQVCRACHHAVIARALIGAVIYWHTESLLQHLVVCPSPLRNVIEQSASRDYSSAAHRYPRASPVAPDAPAGMWVWDQVAAVLDYAQSHLALTLVAVFVGTLALSFLHATLTPPPKPAVYK